MTNNQKQRKIIFLTSNVKFINNEILNTHVCIAITEGDKVIHRFIAVVRKHTYGYTAPDFIINNDEVIVRSVQEKYVCFNRETEAFISDIIDGKASDNTNRVFSVYDVNSRKLDVLFNRFDILKTSAIVDDEKEELYRLNEEIRKLNEETDKLRKDLNDANDCINGFKKSLISAFMSILDVNDKSFAYELLGVKEAVSVTEEHQQSHQPSVNILNVNMNPVDEDSEFVTKVKNHVIAVMQSREIPNKEIIQAAVKYLEKNNNDSRITVKYICDTFGITRNYGTGFRDLAFKFNVQSVYMSPKQKGKKRIVTDETKDKISNARKQRYKALKETQEHIFSREENNI